MGYISRGKTFDEFERGKVYTTASRTITEADLVAFAGLNTPGRLLWEAGWPMARWCYR
jgi:hypothetical protein